MTTEFSAGLRQWRTIRKLSQLELAFRTGLSQRHLSFLETGRAQPSRDSVLLICSALDVPLRDRNVLLTKAGFAATYKESPVPAPDLRHARRALDLLLKQQEPYPAMVLDSLCNIVMANSGMETLTNLFPVTGTEQPVTAQPGNLIRLMLDPGGMRQYVQGWEHFARRTLEHLRCERYAQPLNSDLVSLEAEFLRDSKPAPLVRLPSEPLDVFEMRNGDRRVRLFTMMTTFWPVNDITLSELRIELFFPADEATEELFRVSR